MKIDNDEMLISSESSEPSFESNVREFSPRESSKSKSDPKGNKFVQYRPSTLKKAVILAGGQRTLLSPLTKDCPTVLFPILNKSLIEHTIELMIRMGVSDIVIAGSAAQGGKHIKDIDLDRWPEVNIEYVEDDRPRGTAGVLKSVGDFIGIEPFLVVNGNTYLSDADLKSMLDFHYENQAMVTMGVVSSEETAQKVSVFRDEEIKGLDIIHISHDRRSRERAQGRPSGVYIIEPAALCPT